MNNQLLYDNDIIVAPTSPIGGAVVMVRISGNGCTKLLNGLFKVVSMKEGLKPRHQYFGSLYDGDNVLDEVMVTFFPNPFSYTGEDMLEVSCHASPYIIERLLEILTSHGTRMAKAGEFTFRSYINGKRDMAEAEAVADIIAAESKAQLNVAMAQLKGHLSHQFQSLRDQLLRFTALLELELDFSEEEVEFANRSELVRLCKHISEQIAPLIESYQVGRKIKNGVKTVLAGIPNCGKSSLLNALLGEQRAIVSDIAGTTRDAISETIALGGIPFRFVDTAGIRITNDPIEKLGVEKSFSYVEQSDLVVIVLDPTQQGNITLKHQLNQIPTNLIQAKQSLYLVNKSDCLTHEERQQLKKGLLHLNPLFISSKTGEGIELVVNKLIELSGSASIKSQHLITNARHLALLKQAHQSLEKVYEGLQNELSGDLLSGDLRVAINALGEITGETITSNEVLHHIFSHFCIGK